MSFTYLFVSFAFTLLALHANALFERPPTITRVVSPIVAINQFKNSNYLSLLLFYSSNSQKCRDFENDFLTFAEQNRNLYRFFALDCDTLQDDDRQVFSICQEASTDDFPILIAFEPVFEGARAGEKRMIDHIYTGSGDIASLVEFAESYMPSFHKPIFDKGELDAFTNDQEDTVNKILLFISDNHVPAHFKALTSEYHDIFGFAQIFHGAHDIHHLYGIESYPTIVVLHQNEQGEYSRQTFVGDFDIELLKDFVRPYAIKKDKSKKVEEKSDEPPVVFQKVTVAGLKEAITKEEKMMFIHLHTEIDFPILDEVTSKFRNLFAYYSLDCTSYAAERFAKDTLNVDYFPGIAILPLGKKETPNPILRFAKYNNIVEIMREVSDAIPDTTLSVKSEYLQDTITRAIKDKSPIFILLHEAKEISMSYRVISQMSEYKHKAVFTNVKKPSTEIAERFGTLRLPSLIAIFASDTGKNEQDPDYVQMARFTEKYTLHELTKFVDQVLTLSESTQSIPRPAEATKPDDEISRNPQPQKIRMIHDEL